MELAFSSNFRLFTKGQQLLLEQICGTAADEGATNVQLDLLRSSPSNSSVPELAQPQNKQAEKESNFGRMKARVSLLKQQGLLYVAKKFEQASDKIASVRKAGKPMDCLNTTKNPFRQCMFSVAGAYVAEDVSSSFDLRDSGSSGSGDIYHYDPPEPPRLTPRQWEDCEFSERIDELGIPRKAFIDALEDMVSSGTCMHPTARKLCGQWKQTATLNAEDGEMLLYLVLGRQCEWSLDSVVTDVAMAMQAHSRIQEAIQLQIDLAGISYDAFDAIIKKIWLFVENNLAPRSPLALVRCLAPVLEKENMTLLEFCNLFGPPKLIVQIGPFASILALHEKRIQVEDFLPLDKGENFPTHGAELGESHWGPVYDLGAFNGGLIVKIIKRSRYERRVKGIDKWNDDPAMEVSAHRHLTSLGHPNLVRFEGVTMDNSNVYYYQEKGIELFSIVKKHRAKYWDQWKNILVTKPESYYFDHKSSWEQRMTKIFRGIFEAVAFMHRNRMVHRDLKLENMVVVGAEGDICGKLIDFGVTLRHGEWERDMRNHGKVGTYPFMSPEMYFNSNHTKAAKNGIVIDDFESYDAALNDVWTLGHALWGYIMGVLLWQDMATSDARFIIATRAKYITNPSPWRFRPLGLRYLAKRYGENRNSMCTQDLIDLMEHCLAPEAERWTAEQCLEHPWFSS